MSLPSVALPTVCFSNGHFAGGAYRVAQKLFLPTASGLGKISPIKTNSNDETFYDEKNYVLACESTEH